MTTGPEAGYYADPSIPGYIRYWDGTQWVPGTSRPAPDQSGFDQSGSQQQAAVQEAAAVHEESWQQDTGTNTGTRAAAQVREQLVAVTEPAIAVEQEPAEPEQASDPLTTQSISTMVVPSAFATNRGGYGNATWNGSTGVSGYDASPYAALPGLNEEPDVERADESEVHVVELASAGSRILARIIDLSIAAVVSSPATATLLLMAHRHDHAYVEQLRIQAKTTYRTIGLDATGIGLWAASVVVVLLAAMVVDALRISRSGQTPGRRLVGVQVVTADTASQVGGAVAFTRALLFWILALLPVIDVLALGGVLWGRPYRQGLHEKLTRTITIKA